MTSAFQPTILAIQNDHTDPPHLAGRWLMELGFTIQILRADKGEFVPSTVPEGIAGVMPLGGHLDRRQAEQDGDPDRQERRVWEAAQRAVCSSEERCHAGHATVYRQGIRLLQGLVVAGCGAA